MKNLALHDGRILAYTDVGDPLGYPLIFGHGMPGSRLQGEFFHRQALQHNFRVLTPDRPGIGHSDYKPDRRLLDYPDDIQQLADTLKLETFSHFGWSSGGSRTLACCYKLSSRVDLGVCLSGYTNFAEYGGHHALLESTRWPGPKLASYSPGLVKLVVRLVAGLSRRRPGLYMQEAEKLVNPADRNLLHKLLLEDTFRRDQMLCLESGGKAIATDLLAELENWGFSLKEVHTPILIFQGEEDAFVRADYSRHLAGRLPNAELTLMPGIGHLYPLAEHFQSQLFDRIQRELENMALKSNTQLS
ncbi:MAG: alpha/beta fold hydrolase [Marinobacter sp.]|uniref:alpha/beta fold hydrolase n=1 Tax=Marinobacter sp. TaxID=50741 RepID=UPI003F987C14